MKLLLLLALPPLFSAHAAPLGWERCLDMADYQLALNSFSPDAKITKSGCGFRLLYLSEKRTKYAFDICDSDIALQVFPALDSDANSRYRAGSANCALPLFGADFDADPAHAVPYEEAKDRILNVVGLFERKFDVKNKVPKLDTMPVTERLAVEQVACARILFEEYLLNCMAMEPKAKKEAATDKKNIPVGVHPETIRKK